MSDTKDVRENRQFVTPSQAAVSRCIRREQFGTSVVYSPLTPPPQTENQLVCPVLFRSRRVKPRRSYLLFPCCRGLMYKLLNLIIMIMPLFPIS